MFIKISILKKCFEQRKAAYRCCLTNVDLSTNFKFGFMNRFQLDACYVETVYQNTIGPYIKIKGFLKID